MTLNNHNKGYRNIQFRIFLSILCIPALLTMVSTIRMFHCEDCERREQTRRRREDRREGANYSNNNDNIVNLTRIIISINLDQNGSQMRLQARPVG